MTSFTKNNELNTKYSFQKVTPIASCKDGLCVSRYCCFFQFLSKKVEELSSINRSLPITKCQYLFSVTQVEGTFSNIFVYKNLVFFCKHNKPVAHTRHHTPRSSSFITRQDVDKYPEHDISITFENYVIICIEL